MILAADTTITIDGAFIAAFFVGIVGVIGALVAAYIKIRQWQQENKEAQETAAAAVAASERAVVANVKAVEKVHKIVNSRDTAQRALIADQTSTIKSLAVEVAALTGRTNGKKLVPRKPAKRKPARRR